MNKGWIYGLIGVAGAAALLWTQNGLRRSPVRLQRRREALDLQCRQLQQRLDQLSRRAAAR